MPEELDEYDKFGTSGASGRDWDTFLDGRIRRFRRGVDFYCTANSFRVQAYKAATNRSKVVKTRLEDSDSIVLQAFDK